MNHLRPLAALVCVAVLAHAQEPALSPATPTTNEDAAREPPHDLSPVVVKAKHHKDPIPPVPRWGFRIDGRPGSLSFDFSINLMGPFVITAARTPQPPEDVAHRASVFYEPGKITGAITLDGALRSVPAFTLFRRSDSLTANPTAQGVSLRGLGPSGASRSLVLLDGVPLNDPFGGWVAWTKVPRDGLARVEVIPGGGAAAWGNASLGGVVQLFTRPNKARHDLVRFPPPPGSSPYAEGPMVWGSLPTANFNVQLGDYSTRSVEFSAVYPAEHGTLQVLGDDFSTGGFSLVAPERRGPIDVGAWSRHRWLTFRWRMPVGKKMELSATARGYEEFRGNGTPYTRNGSREKFTSVQLAGQPTDNFAWDAVAYAQDQSFASTFSSVNATRTAETPASDQFAVPATAFGAAWTGSWRNDGNAHTSFGFDARTVRGETRENFTFAAGNFTRQRIAGGDQGFTGIFALHERPLTTTLHASVGMRFDIWRESDGHRLETDRASGAVLRDDHYSERDGTEFSPSAGLVWNPDKTWRVRASAQRAFRVPTLNELYRPFRQGTTVVETNPDLRTEHNTSAEFGIERNFFTPAPLDPKARYANGPPPPIKTVTLRATAFWNDLRDAIGNVTLARGPGTFPIFGTLAAGGIGRQRLNVDRLRVQGLEFSASWRISEKLSLSGSALLSDPEVRRATISPNLVGNQVAQVPRHSASLGAGWRAPGGIMITPGVRWIGRQWEDDENTLRLGEALVANLGASRPLNKHLELFLTIENLGNARLETGRSADGVVNIGTPRLAIGGLRGSW